jgi:hypothetical protein
MKRRSSGQVLIGAATLMLVILLTMAASLPVINTSIDPSSKVYNLALYAVRSAVDDLITRMSAYQCATALWYADARHKNIDFTGHAKEIENRIKNSLIQVASKSYNLELRRIIVAIPVAKIKILSTVWDGNPDSPSAGNVEISMGIHVYVSFEYRIKNSGANFQKYTTWYEEYLTIKGEGGIIDNAPWQGLPWVEFYLGFVPIVGALVGNIKGVKFALPLKVTQYKAVFDNQRVFTGVELDDLSRRLELVMLKPRDKVERGGGVGPDERWFETIRWVEYNKIDWGAIAIGIAIDLIPWGKVLKATKAIVKQDIANDGAGTLYFSTNQIKWTNNIAQQIYKRMTDEELKKVSKTNTNTATNNYFGQPKGGQGGKGGQGDESSFAQIFQNKISNEIKDAINYNAGAAVSGTIKQESKTQGSAFQDYLAALGAFHNSIGLGPPSSRAQITKSEGNELYQSTASGGKLADYIVNNNPIVWVGLPLHNGKSLFGVCVWLIGAYYPGDA